MENKTELISIFKESIIKCRDDECFISVHINKDGFIARHTFIPEEVEISLNSIYISSNMFVIDIQDNFNIEYDEFDNSYCLSLDNGIIIYFDNN